MMQRGLGSATYGSDQIVHIPTFFKALKMSGLVNRTGHYVASAQVNIKYNVLHVFRFIVYMSFIFITQPSATTTFAIST